MVKLTRWQEGTLGFVLVVDLLMPVLSVLVSMSNKMPVGAVVVFCALVALACLGLMRLVDRQPGRLGLPASVTGPKVLAFVVALVACAFALDFAAYLVRDIGGMLVLMGVIAVVQLSLVVFVVALAAGAGDSGLAGGVTWPWVILIVLGGAIGMLVFWYLNVWRAHDPVAVSRLTSASS